MQSRNCEVSWQHVSWPAEWSLSVEGNPCVKMLVIYFLLWDLEARGRLVQHALQLAFTFCLLIHTRRDIFIVFII